MFHPEEEGAHTREVQRTWGRGGTGDWLTLPRQALEVYSVKVVTPGAPTPHPCYMLLHLSLLPPLAGIALGREGGGQ